MKQDSSLQFGILMAFSAIVFAVWFKFNLPSRVTESPKPTEVIYTTVSEEEKHKKKAAWIEQMHQTAPDVDWRALDRQTREKRRSIFPRYKSQSADTFANGALIGKWSERGSNNQSGRILMTDFDPTEQKIYCTSQGGNVWRANADGTQWEVLNDHYNLGNSNYLKLFSKPNGNRIFVSGSGGFCYYSDDDGNNWQTATGLSNIESWGGIRKTVSTLNKNQTLFTLALEWDYIDWGSVMSVYVSQDQGTSFQKAHSIKRSIINGNSNLIDLWAPRYQPNNAYLAYGDSLFTIDTNSLDRHFIGNLPVFPQNRLLITGSSYYGKTVLYAYIDQDIYKSSNGGITWTKKGNVGANPFRNTSFYCKMQDTTTVYLGGVDCLVSNDNGNNWIEINKWYEYYQDVENKLHADIPSINEYLDTNGTPKLLIATDGGLYSSTLTFTVSNLSLAGHNASQYYSVYTNQNDNNFIYAGSQDQGMQRASLNDNGILNFEQVISGDYGYIVSSDGGNSMWTVYPGFAHFYPDAKFGGGEARWNFDSLRDEYWMPPLEEHPTNAEKVYLAGGHLKKNLPGSYIIELTRNGNSITAQALPYNFSQTDGEQISAFEINDSNTDYWYVLTNEGNFYYSTDGGQNFTANKAINGPGAHYFFGATIHTSLNNPNLVFIGGSGYSNPAVFISENHGQSFTQLADSLPNTLVFDLVGTPDDSLLFAATQVGAYVLNINQGQWELMHGLNGPDQVYWAVEYLPNTETVRFATHGRGIWDFKRIYPQPTITESHSKPQAIKVYPNPTSKTLFVSGLNQNAVVSCFSLSGKQLQLTQNQNQFEVSHLTNGTYFLNIQQNGKLKVLKFVKQ